MDGETVADNVIGFKLVASQLLAKAFIGFGMDTDIDIFTVPPVLDENHNFSGCSGRCCAISWC